MSEESIISVIIAVLSGGTVGALISFWANRKKNNAETDNIIVEGAKALLEPLTNQVNRLEGDLCKERTERERFERELEQVKAERERFENELEKVKNEGEKASEANIVRIIALETALLAKDKEIASLQFEAAELKEKVISLEKQLEELGKTPVTKEKSA